MTSWTRRELASLQNQLRDAFTEPDPDPDPVPRRDGLRPALARRRAAERGGVTDEQHAVAAAQIIAAVRGECPDRAAAKARFEASDMATMLRESRAAVAAQRAEMDCYIAWSAQDDRDVADLLACRTD